MSLKSRCRCSALVVAALPFLLQLAAVHVVDGFATASPAWEPVDLPSPQDDTGAVCGHAGRQSAVCDPDGVLSEEEVQTIDGLANFIAEGSHGFAKINCASRMVGYQVAVAVLHKMKPDGSTSVTKRAENFAKALHDAWGVGEAECNNGVVLLVVLDDKRLHISTGSGVKRLLTDALVQTVLGRMKPALREGKVGTAVQIGVTAIGDVLAGRKPNLHVNVVEGIGILGNIVSYAVFFAAVFWMSIVGCSGYRDRQTYRRCQAALRRLEHDRELAHQSRYESISCPICLEEFAKESPPSTPMAETTSLVAAASPQDLAVSSSIPSPSSSGNAPHLTRRITVDGSLSNPRAGLSATNNPEIATAEGTGHGSSDSFPSETNPSATTSQTMPISPPQSGFLASRVRTATAGHGAGMGTTEAPERETQVLRCGHKFHVRCLRSMVEASYNQCCICRQPMFGTNSREDRPNDRPSGDSSSSSDNNHLRSSEAAARDDSFGIYRRIQPHDWEWFYPEYVFRLQRARYLYPRYVTVDMVERWQQRDGYVPIVQDHAFRAIDPAVLASARQSGSSGSSYSFGGGGSSGGGGGGSSW